MMQKLNTEDIAEVTGGVARTVQTGIDGLNAAVRSGPSKSDKQIAERKIAEYKSRLNDTTYSIYADTTRRFDKLLSFESKLAGSSFERITSRRTNDEKMALLPLFKFTFTQDSTEQTATARKYHSQRAEDFVKRLDNPLLAISCRESNIAPDSLVAINRRLKAEKP
mgnify:CR=1 FL=1